MLGWARSWGAPSPASPPDYRGLVAGGAGKCRHSMSMSERHEQGPREVSGRRPGTRGQAQATSPLPRFLEIMYAKVNNNP